MKTLLGVPSIEFYAPPPDKDDPNADITGITAWLFPEWFIAQFEERNPETGVRSRPLVHRLDLVKGQLYERDKKRYKVVPVRFVQACLRGHVSDIDWRVFVHGKEDKCQRSLWMDERGTSGDLTDITIRCECGKFKALSAATKLDDVPLGYCNGPRPWLGNFARERCGGGDEAKVQFNRLLVRSASNAYFAQTLSVISIPEPGGALRQAVDSVWVDFLQYAESEADVARERKKQKVSVGTRRVLGRRSVEGRPATEDGCWGRCTWHPRGRDRDAPFVTRARGRGSTRRDSFTPDRFRSRTDSRLSPTSQQAREGSSSPRSDCPGRFHEVRIGGGRHQR